MIYPSISDIQARVCAQFRVHPIEMVSSRRSRDCARPRQVAMYLCRHLTTKSLPQIGRAFGGRDHTTVIHACRQIEHLRAEDEDLDRSLNLLAFEISQLSAISNATSCGDNDYFPIVGTPEAGA